MLTFPKDFLWGCAAASYQVEGAYNEGGRGESIWDHFCRIPGNVDFGHNGDVACDHYHRWQEDIALMQKLGLKSYRFSIAWSRIFPNGIGEPNPEGIAFYQDLVDGLLAAGIQPSVTMYHWDLPQALQDIGGWTNPAISDYFEAYAKCLFAALGGKVTSWITLNEPYCTSFLGYWEGSHAPGYHDFSAALKAAHNLLLAHGKTVSLFRKLGLPGEIGITLNMNSYYPLTDCPADAEAAEMAHEAWNYWFSDPILKGRYPKLRAFYEQQGLMPVFPESDFDIIAQPIDFIGLNNYFSQKASANANAWPLPVDQHYYGEAYTDMGWGVNPEGMYDLLIKLHRDYDGIKLYITENGCAFQDIVDMDGNVTDTNRIDYLRRYLTGIHKAISEGVNLHGYYQWSLLDNFEWARGYTKRFGIVYVDYATQQRIIKSSGHWYADVIRNNGF